MVGDRGLVGQVDARLEARTRGRPVHRAGVEVLQAEPARRPRGRRWTCPSRTARRWRRRGDGGAQRAGVGRHRSTSSDAVTRGVGTAARIIPRPRRASPLAQRSLQPLGRRRQHRDLGQPDQLAGRVLQPSSSRLIPASADVGEQPGQLARRSGSSTVTTAYAVGGRAVLARDPRPGRRCPAAASPATAGRRHRRPGAGQRLDHGRPGRSAGRAAPRATGPAFAARICAQSAGSLAAIRVTSRRPCPARPTAGSRRLASRAATRLAATWGTCETRATASSCAAGVHRHRAGAERRWPAGATWSTAAATGAVGGGRPPRAGRGTGRPGRPPARTARGRPSGARRRTGAGRRRRPAPPASEPGLDAGHVGDRRRPGARPARRPRAAVTSGGAADHDEVAGSSPESGSRRRRGRGPAPARSATGRSSTRDAEARSARPMLVPSRPVPTTRTDAQAGGGGLVEAHGTPSPRRSRRGAIGGTCERSVSVPSR